MGKFKIYEDSRLCDILVEPSAFEGVHLVASAVSEDIELTCGKKPAIFDNLTDTDAASVIVAATVGKSDILNRLVSNGKVSLDGVEGKREVYRIVRLEKPFIDAPAIEEALIVIGSDKRGTIYGLFDISERIGVSPLVYWGDAVPKQRSEVSIDYGAGYTSKEPSVKYRGLFINDDWPAFGGWSHKRFGGYNAKAYDPVFQLILRLKGNYMWPAMWTAIFSEDGPGLKNAELADAYGIVIGASHHEPMCRAGAEWQKIYKNYGDDNIWSFISNRDAITEFWRDGLKRNKDFENVITVGMRGENDSLLLGKNATLEDNINVLRNVITTQNELMKEIVNPELSRIPRMLALYYEVEDFYHGDETAKGLKNWDALDGVILMLCDDTFANLRFLPDDTDRDHNGGFGMYYHYDYHGASISYEWMNTNRLTKTWEQMTMAYDYGVRDLWIVNLGDIKGLEYPLCYFMSLAYDFDKYGTTALNSVEGFVKDWVKQQYGDWLTDSQLEDVYTVLNGYTKYNNLRTPESMNQNIYAPFSFREGERVYNECEKLIKLSEELYRNAPKPIKASIFYEVYYPAVASLNFVQMAIEASWNSAYAARGSLAANKYLNCVKKRVQRDTDLRKEFDTLLNGKWVHMADSAHHGFRSWNNENWFYPAMSEVVPIPNEKSFISFAGQNTVSLGRYWNGPRFIENREFLRPDTEKITINIETGSSAKMEYHIHCEKPWLEFITSCGFITAEDGMASVDVKIDRSKLEGIDSADVIISCTFTTDDMSDKDSVAMYDHQVGKTMTRLKIYAGGEYNYPSMTFVDTDGYISMEASHYSDIHAASNAEWKAIDHLSRIDTPAMKVFPSTAFCLYKHEDKYPSDDIPYLEYSFVTEHDGDYDLKLYLSNRNPVAIDAHLRLGISANGEEPRIIHTVPAGYKPGMHGSSEWGKEVLDKVRIITVPISVKNGVNKLRIYGGDPNILVEKLVAYPTGHAPEKSYLGPPESYYVK